MLAWFPFPFQLVNKLNLRLPQIAVKDKKWKAFPFHSCWRHLHPRCDSHEKQKQTQRRRQASLSQAPEREGQPDYLNRGQMVSISPPYWESTSFLDLLWWRTWQGIWKVSLIPDIPHVQDEAQEKRSEQSQKAGGPMILQTQRTSLTRRHEKVWGDIATQFTVERTAWPSRSFFTLLICPAILWMVSKSNIEADPSSAAINKFSSKSHCSCANSYKLQIWLVGSLLLEICTSEIFSDSFLVSSGHQKKYYKDIWQMCKLTWKTGSKTTYLELIPEDGLTYSHRFLARPNPRTFLVQL